MAEDFDTSASPKVSKSSAIVEHQETLDLYPLQHEPPKTAEKELLKKKFKTRFSNRYHHSMKRKAFVSTVTPIEIPDDDDVNVDEVITTAVNAILEEVDDDVMGSDVEPDAAT